MALRHTNPKGGSGMIRINTRVLIDRPAAEVFDYVADFENAPEWQAGVVKSGKVTEGPIMVGTKFEEDVRIVFRKARTVCMVTDLNTGKSLAFAATSKPVDYQGTFTFEQTPRGTLLTLEANCEMNGAWKLLEPLMSLDAKSGVKKELGRIKKALESRRAATRRAVRA